MEGGENRWKSNIAKIPGGPLLGYTRVKLIEKDGLYFKDMDGTGELKPYVGLAADPGGAGGGPGFPAVRGRDRWARCSIPPTSPFRPGAAGISACPPTAARNSTNPARKKLGIDGSAEEISEGRQRAPRAGHHLRKPGSGRPLEQRDAGLLRGRGLFHSGEHLLRPAPRLRFFRGI